MRGPWRIILVARLLGLCVIAAEQREERHLMTKKNLPEPLTEQLSFGEAAELMQVDLA